MKVEITIEECIEYDVIEALRDRARSLKQHIEEEIRNPHWSESWKEAYKEANVKRIKLLNELADQLESHGPG